MEVIKMIKQEWDNSHLKMVETENSDNIQDDQERDHS